MIEWETLWLIIAATSWAVTCLTLALLVHVLNRDRRAEAFATYASAETTAAVAVLLAEWCRELRGYERGQVAHAWPALSKRLSHLARAAGRS